MAVRIRSKKDTYVVDYPEAVAFTDQQMKIFWPPDEINVGKDIQDILVNMTEAERHGVIMTLKLFTKYELIIGQEFWLGFVYKNFPRPADIQPMAAFFGAMELAVHGRFYNNLNEELGLATDEFYSGYKDDPELAQRIDFLEDVFKDTSTELKKLKALAIFTFSEGAILYSAFAYLKSFQSAGKNKLLNVVSGINFSARDESLHGQAAAWLYKTYRQELLDAGEVTQAEVEELEKELYEAGELVFEHEKLIIAKIFEKGSIEGITAKQLEYFTQSRINLCLRDLGHKDLYTVNYNPIGKTFYAGINGFSLQDFFSSQGNQYSRGWDKKSFTFGNVLGVENETLYGVQE